MDQQSQSPSLSATLAQASCGNPRAREELVDELYTRLRAMAGSMFQHEREGHTLQPTALVNEAWIRLAASENLDHSSRTIFLAAAAKTLRRVLVDHARHRNAQKRGGYAVRVELGELEAPSVPATQTQVDWLDQHLREFAEAFPRQHDVVELKYFSGLTVAQIAAVLELSERTVANDWEFARAWMRSRLVDPPG